MKFALKYQDEFFYDLPMVFFGVNDLQFAQDACKNPYMIGFYENDYLNETIETAVDCLPERKILVALHDESTAGVADMNIFYSFAERYPEYSFMDIDSAMLSQDELISALKNLPEGSILFYMTCYSDKFGNNYSMLNRTRTIVNNVTVPIFRNYSGGRDAGVLGGTYMDFRAQAKSAGSIMKDILNKNMDMAEN